MDINPKIFKAYDIRGIYPTDINEEIYERIIRGIYTLFVRQLKKENLQIVLSRDMRLSSPSLSKIARETLIKCGATVIDIGLTSTPTFYYAALKYGYDAGIQVTASHNPKDYAGAKFVTRDGDKLNKIGKDSGMDDVRKYASTEDFVPFKEGGKLIERNDVLDNEVDEAIKDLGVDPNTLKKFKVVCDPGNAMGGLYVEKLFEKVPGELIKMNFELDGTFPVHEPNPLKYDTLRGLQKRVVEEKADLGIAPDGDGDRVFFINEKGDIIDATFVTSLISQEVLKQNPGSTIVVDIRYTRNVKNTVKRLGGKTFISKVGHAFITRDVNEQKAYFAGESSGHFYFGNTGGGESSVRVILYMLEAMSRENKPISEILASLRSSDESGEFNYEMPEGTNSKLLLQDIADQFKDGEVSWLDGVAVDYPDWRFNIRTSNTEPLIRLNVEGASKELVAQKLSDLQKMITDKDGQPKH